jgi:hypothetical protein
MGKVHEKLVVDVKKGNIHNLWRSDADIPAMGYNRI